MDRENIKLSFVQNMILYIGNQREDGDKSLEWKREFSKFSDDKESILKSMVFYIPTISNKKV